MSSLCHSGLSGIFLTFQKDSRRASLAGMTFQGIKVRRGFENINRTPSPLSSPTRGGGDEGNDESGKIQEGCEKRLVKCHAELVSVASATRLRRASNKIHNAFGRPFSHKISNHIPNPAITIASIDCVCHCEVVFDRGNLFRKGEIASFHSQ